MLPHWSINWLCCKKKVWKIQNLFFAANSHIDFYVTPWRWEERERGRETGREANICFTLSLCFHPPFCRNAPWIPFVNHPATDTSLCHHLFSASGNHCAQALLERPSRILPDCLTNEEPKPILWGCCVLHITGPDKSPSLCSTQKEPRLFRIKTHGKLQFAFAFHKLSSAEPTNNSVCFLSVSLAGIWVPKSTEIITINARSTEFL